MNKRAATPALCIFEDDRFPNFFPIALYRPVFELSVGTESLAARLVDEIDPESVVLWCRPYLAAALAAGESRAGKPPVSVGGLPEGEILFLNGRLLAYAGELEELLAGLSGEGILRKMGTVVAARLSGERAAAFKAYIDALVSDSAVERVVGEIRRLCAGGRGEDLERADASRTEALTRWATKNRVKLAETNVRLLSHHWQLIEENRRAIVDDFQKNPFRGTSPDTELFKGVELINENDIVIGSDAEVRSGTVLDASEGAIVIANNARIEPNAIVTGPCSIGEGAIVRGGAKVGHGTSLGRRCRIGGEVEECVVAPFTNKQHEGFMGHTYVGSWVNIGAGTCTSDLKNN